MRKSSKYFAGIILGLVFTDFVCAETQPDVDSLLQAMFTFA